MNPPTPPPIPPPLPPTPPRNGPPPPPMPVIPVGQLTGREQYNVVTDTVIGVNVRLKDNLFQGLACISGCGIGAAVGYFKAESPNDAFIYAALGAIAGLLGGLLVSGIVLMIYRGLRHAKGRHD